MAERKLPHQHAGVDRVPQHELWLHPLPNQQHTSALPVHEQPAQRGARRILPARVSAAVSGSAQSQGGQEGAAKEVGAALGWRSYGFSSMVRLIVHSVGHCPAFQPVELFL